MYNAESLCGRRVTILRFPVKHEQMNLSKQSKSHQH